jgi:glycyl-tRNA synthetase beta chain
MPEFFLELFSEEIPARMQREAASQLEKLCATALESLHISEVQTYYGPRRIALKAKIASEIAPRNISERGPRASAPEQALAGFLRKHDATRDQLVQEGDFWVLYKTLPAASAAQSILDNLPKTLAQFPWPKSMRWGQGGDFTWVRPLRRIICLLDGEIIPFTLGPITASNVTEGHRIHGPGPFTVSSAATWEESLREHDVIADQTERRRRIANGIAEQAAALNLTVAPDDALLDDVTGLVEYPVPLIGRIDADFMDLPLEVRELSMKINQKYFALRHPDGTPAPYFAFIANLEAHDSGTAIIAGNERVLRARLSDARHFWDMDLKTSLFHSVPKLEKITFHAKLGTQLERAERIAALAHKIAELLGGDEKNCLHAAIAGRLCKADLVTGMVGEFPELQGIMGGYYATLTHGPEIGDAIKTHYQPKGPTDPVPTGTLAVSVALADKFDTLTKFFEINEKPTGSGDPYALRRAALGVIRIILENNLRLSLKPLLNNDATLFDFIIDRLRVKLRGEGKRFDVLDAVLAAAADDDLVRIMKRVDALGAMLATDEGKNLHAAYKRAANILAIEEKKDGQQISGAPNAALFTNPELELDHVILEAAGPQGLFKHGTETEDFGLAMRGLATMRRYVDGFFEKVTVNAPEPELRLNRLRLLARFRDTVNIIADFSKIEG